MPFGRVSEIQGERPANRDERLVLRPFEVPRADRAGRVADQVRTRVAQAGEVGERGPKAPGVVRVLVPVEVVGSYDVEAHG